MRAGATWLSAMDCWCRSGGGTVRATVAQFPLMSFTDRDLRAISVVGVNAADVLIGGQAERDTD